MTKIVVTVVCSLGVLVSLGVIVTGRGVETNIRSDDGDPWRVRARREVSAVCAAIAAGAIGGLLSIGMGSRLMMRVLAATSPDATGRLTDADEIVGEVSGGGTGFLLAAGTFIGVVGAVGYLGVRRLLPARSLVAGLVGMGIAGGLLARPSALLDPDNRDFAILEPRWLAVILCVVVIAIGPLMIAVLVDRWAPRWPTPGLSLSGLAGLAPLALLALIPPLLLALAVIVAVRTIRFPRPPSLTRLGRVLLSAGGALGLAWIGASGVAILV
ncbi:MAG: hypothetical protein DHS20C19_11560 [Acidimicrobiales bacterium]|nr:MAG: hypothetical protein DHS20C19_11560 [Acidimicrobiales bacterium]